MPGFMDMMRQRFGGGRMPLQTPGFQGQGGPAMGGQMGGPMSTPPPAFQPRPNPGMDYGMPPMDSGIVRPGQFGGMDEFQEPSMAPPMQPKSMMRGIDEQTAVRRPRPQMGRGRKLGQGGEPVF